MLTMVIGGSASGKSEYAEKHVLSLETEIPRIYLATMEPFGREAHVRIARHRAMRRDRGFETMECYRELGKISLPADSNVLLEDLGNLLANELFGNPLREEDPQAILFQADASRQGEDWAQLESSEEAEAADTGIDLLTDPESAGLPARIAGEIESLYGKCRHLTVVTNEVFSGGNHYGEETILYLRFLAEVNRRLAGKADRVVEMVCGLPEILKG